MGSPKLYRSLKNESGNSPIQFSTKQAIIPIVTPNVFNIRSSINQSVTIDWGDGTSNNLSLTANVSASFPQHTYGVGYGAGVSKLITITAQNNSAITSLAFQQIGVDGPAPSNLEQCTGLTSLQFVGSSLANYSAALMTTFPGAIANLVSMDQIIFQNTFLAGSEFANKIPISVFNKPLSILSFIEQLGTDWTSNNVDKIYLLNSTLRDLSLGNANTRSNFNSLPNDSTYGFQNLTLLETFSCRAAGSFGAIPSVINGMVKLKVLQLQQCDINDWGNLVNCVDLTTITFSNNTALPTTLPSYLTSLTKLKTLIMAFTWQSQVRIDTFVDNFYAFVTANAPITGTSANAFRSMVLTITGSFSPAGIFQTPVGYVAGVSNGSPASPKEKIWVLVNQYAHTITYS